MAHPGAETIHAEVGDGTVASAFLATARAHPDRCALRWRDGEEWAGWTWAEYADRVARATRGLVAAGVEPGDRVVLMLRNSPWFHVLDLAVVYAGGTPVSIYNSSPAEQVAYLAGHCRATMAVAEDEGFLERFRAARSRTPTLRTLAGIEEGDADLSLDELLGTGPADLESCAERVDPDGLATVIYTSGTTGPPKGVMLTHRQILFTAAALRYAFGIPPEELVGLRMVSYLPMAHIAERINTHYTALHAGFEVTCCPELTAVAGYLPAVRPHILFGVPRVWEKIHAGVTTALAADPDKEARFAEAVAVAEPIVEARTWGRSTPEQEETWRFLDEVAFAPVRQLLGFDELRLALTGAAPIPAGLLGWYRAIGVPLSEIYGLSETCGPATWEPYRVKPGTVGRAIPGCELRSAGDGEIQCRGGNVFSGYLDDPERTADVLTPDGWLRTGDIGEVDEDGYWRIVDRKKELIITAGGTNVSPANLEARLKTIPLVGQACAVGDGRPYVAALVVLDPDQAAAFAAREQLAHGSLAELAEHPRINEEVCRGVEEVMADLPTAERVRRVVVLGEEWLPDSEELTPTSKLKRRAVHARYADRIEELYG